MASEQQNPGSGLNWRRLSPAESARALELGIATLWECLLRLEAKQARLAAEQAAAEQAQPEEIQPQTAPRTRKRPVKE